MRLFNKMKDPVRGSAKVAYTDGGTTRPAPWHMRLVVTADGVPPTEVQFKATRHLDRWPNQGDTIPVTVDRANPQNITIEWSEMRKISDSLDQYAEQATQAALAEARGEAPSIAPEDREGEESAEDFNEDARKIWRMSLERGRCSREGFEKQMQDLDGLNWRERQPADFLAKHGLNH